MVKLSYRLREGNKGYYEVLHASYVRVFSEGLQRKLWKLHLSWFGSVGETNGCFSHTKENEGHKIDWDQRHTDS